MPIPDSLNLAMMIIATFICRSNVTLRSYYILYTLYIYMCVCGMHEVPVCINKYRVFPKIRPSVFFQNDFNISLSPRISSS